MPGTLVTTAARSGPSAQDIAPASTFIVPGLAERGRADRAVLLHSMGDYAREFGNRVSYGYMYDALRGYFEDGGDKAYAVRVVGPAATVGTRTLSDRAGTPLATIRLDAIGAGAWSSGITVQVSAGAVGGTFKVTLVYNGETESYDNLDTPAEAVTAINARSRWVVATDLGSVTVAPNNQPAVLAATAFSAGSDDRASVVAADYITALNSKAVYALGAGAVAVPGQISDTIGAGLIAHAKANNRVALLSVGLGTAVADAISAAQSLLATPGSEGAGLFYPWVKVPDGSGLPGATRLVPPEGFVAASRAKAHITEGPWRAGAGIISESRYVVGIETEINRTDGDKLDASNVNAIRTIAGTSRVYGWRSLSSDEANYFMLSGRDTLNYLVVEAEKRLEKFVFRTIDGRGHLLSDINADLVGLVEPLRVRGGLYEIYDGAGKLVDPGYHVETGPSVNPLTQLAQNIVAAELGVRISPTGALVKLLITKVGLTAVL